MWEVPTLLFRIIDDGKSPKIILKSLSLFVNFCKAIICPGGVTSSASKLLDRRMRENLNVLVHRSKHSLVFPHEEALLIEMFSFPSRLKSFHSLYCMINVVSR
jgi:hypothetical protein